MIELMIASIVLMVGLISVVSIAAYVSRTNSTSNTINVVVSSAQDQADKLRNLTWSLAAEDPRLTVGGALTYGSADNNHRALIEDTSAGTLEVCWLIANGPGTTGDARTVTIKVVQQNAPPRLADGVTISMIISRS